MHVACSWDESAKALFARNPYHPDYGRRVAFAAIVPEAISYTSDRTEFLGRNGSAEAPAALRRVSLSNRTGAGLDPCGALQTKFELGPGEEKTVILMLGQADDVEHARRLIARYRDPATVEQALAETREWWDRPPDHNSGQDAGAFRGSADESLAALPIAELPHLGAIRFVSIERRVWFSRPVAGCAGVCLFSAGYCARDDSAGRFAAVRRRRRAALVASAFRRRCPHADVRTICCGFRTRCASMWRSRATWVFWMPPQVSSRDRS